jgi:hypothetical protein
VYHDNTNTSRSGFRYTYKGKDLVNFVIKKLKDKCGEQKRAREEVIRLTRDPAVSSTDRKVEDAKRDVTTAATVVEELSVYAHEFQRYPEREYNLSLGDVVFFGLISPEISTMVENAIRPNN